MTRADVIAVLDEHYDLHVRDLEPVAAGADLAASLWRATDRDGRGFAVKWTGGGSPAGLVLPAALSAVRPGSTPRPLPSRTGALWVDTGGRRLSVLEWVAGPGAMDAALDRDGWTAMGRLLAALHALPVTGELRRSVPREGFDPSRWVDLFDRVDAAVDRPADGAARRLAEAWRERRADLRALREHTAGRAEALRARTDLPGFVPCHADPHLGNVIRATEGGLVLIDFDDAVIAPRERDLMFVIGGGVLADMPATPEQQAWFLDGYGPHDIDRDLLGYYRGVRVLEDVAEPASVVLDPGSTADDRTTGLGYVTDVLSPTGLLAQALDGHS
ncbi:spectinomycin phosphotransferase [Murinocardiopsis flavida]|uniref:Spectinomycin phosphotransferase n=1 Tax=Murinocardiopsis flavida TaxID=645275 RepID=A0A2P8DUJ4_9ACTN|nr:phosphotransferase [Murinocardiopsis flavida]PSL00883.1 spectinomycin phosphotransferase [Murinocardiopsis flavida]